MTSTPDPVTVHPIDRGRLSTLAATVLDDGHYLVDEEEVEVAQGIRGLLDALAAAEHRATRAEAQAEARRIDLDYWRQRAGVMKKERDWNIESSRRAKKECIKAEARIKAVEDVLAQSAADTTMHRYPEELNAAIRRALDGTDRPPGA